MTPAVTMHGERMENRDSIVKKDDISNLQRTVMGNSCDEWDISPYLNILSMVTASIANFGPMKYGCAADFHVGSEEHSLVAAICSRLKEFPTKLTSLQLGVW
jgi:hypothetical protein